MGLVKTAAAVIAPSSAPPDKALAKPLFASTQFITTKIRLKSSKNSPSDKGKPANTALQGDIAANKPEPAAITGGKIFLARRYNNRTVNESAIAWATNTERRLAPKM